MRIFVALVLILVANTKQVFCQNNNTSIGINLVGPAELFDVHLQYNLKNHHHFLLAGAMWKPTSEKFAIIDDINYLVFPVQYQYHFYIKQKWHFDANAGVQLQYNISTILPNHLKVTPTIGLSATKNFKANCFYVRAGALVFVPTYLSVDKYETFAYTLNRWLIWPQIGFGKYLH